MPCEVCNLSSRSDDSPRHSRMNFRVTLDDKAVGARKGRRRHSAAKLGLTVGVLRICKRGPRERH